MRTFFKTRFGRDKYLYKIMYALTGATPHNIELYKLALIHRSASININISQLKNKTEFTHDTNTQNNLTPKTDAKIIAINNERLEFLGDAILQAVVSSIVFVDYPYHAEGELSMLRAKIVSRDTLNLLAKKLCLNKYIATNPPQLAAKQQNILGDAFEALIGAIYLDHGFDKTAEIIDNLLSQKVDIDKIEHTERDFKSRVLEWSQKNKRNVTFITNETPESLPHNPQFVTVIKLDDADAATAIGRNKKRAEQKAAKMFFDEIIEK